MTTLEWFFGMTLFVIYIVALFTVCGLTFRKGYMLLGIVGIFFPILWFIGAILPAKPGSRLWIDQGIRESRAMDEMVR